jgi:hypothetical protein
VLLLDVVRAAIAETEDLDRVAFYLDERLAVTGQSVTDLTHLLAELVENAVRFSPPEASVIIRLRPYPASPGSHVLTIEDCGIGMRREDLDAANELLAHPQEIDLSVSQRLGLHVVARLAERHGVSVSLTLTPGSGITAVVVLPAALFGDVPAQAASPAIREHALPVESVGVTAARAPRVDARARNGEGARPWSVDEGAFAMPTDFGLGETEPWSGWWEPVLTEAPADQASHGSFLAEDQASHGSYPPADQASHGSFLAEDQASHGSYPPADQASNGSFLAEGPAGGRAEPPDAASPGQADAAGEPRLARRVPQAHLAPELRDPSGTVEPAPPSVAEGNRTREALSRYQASRQAARAMVEASEEPGLDTSGFDTTDRSGGGQP